jgi:hypothetical protein
MAADDVLDLGRIDPFAAGLDQVLGAAADGQVAASSMLARSPVSK